MVASFADELNTRACPGGDCFRPRPMVCFGQQCSRRKPVLTRILSPAIVAVMLSLTAGSFAQAQSRPRETIHVGIIDRTFFFHPVLVSIQNGFFADEGLNANMRFIRSGEGQAEGLLKGDLHFALSSTEGIMQNVERGGPLRMLAANSGR